MEAGTFCLVPWFFPFNFLFPFFVLPVFVISPSFYNLLSSFLTLFISSSLHHLIFPLLILTSLSLPLFIFISPSSHILLSTFLILFFSSSLLLLLSLSHLIFSSSLFLFISYSLHLLFSYSLHLLSSFLLFFHHLFPNSLFHEPPIKCHWIQRSKTFLILTKKISKIQSIGKNFQHIVRFIKKSTYLKHFCIPLYIKR